MRTMNDIPLSVARRWSTFRGETGMATGRLRRKLGQERGQDTADVCQASLEADRTNQPLRVEEFP